MKAAFLFHESLRALKSNPFRTLLTTLGVIIGVAAVIAMMSISGGAREETLKEIRSLGAENIYVKASKLTGESLDKAKQALSEGLTRQDLVDILAKVPHLKGGTFEMQTSHSLRYGKDEPKSTLVGVGTDYFNLVPGQLKFGRLFRPEDFSRSAKVVILGERVCFELFGNSDPVGNFVEIDSGSYQIVGVLQNAKRLKQGVKSGDEIKIGDRELDRDAYVPYSVFIDRFMLLLNRESDSEKDVTYHEASTLILKVDGSENLVFVRDFVQKILDSRHRGINDYQIIAPVELLEKSNRVQRIFSLVMTFIAGLSLIVGGIGIMNIMLANIQQRIKEIGIRRAIGATKQDILYQFLFEAVMISVGGGLLGIFTGFAISGTIALYTGWTTVTSVTSILVSFIVSVTVGLIFGIFPAWKASELDPITALRYE